jgi:outer membrane protein
VIAQGGSMLPSISLQATYANNNFQGGDTAAYGLSQGIDKEVAIVATWNIFQTPAVSASADSSGPLWSLTVKQQKLYEAQQANEDYTLRALVASVRQDYLNVVADSQSVKAYQQSVISGQASLAQYQAQYKVGTQTLTAVLQQVQNLYQAKQNYSQAQYKYITDLLQLKLDAGTLSVTDVQDLNQWLQG